MNIRDFTGTSTEMSLFSELLARILGEVNHRYVVSIEQYECKRGIPKPCSWTGEEADYRIRLKNPHADKSKVFPYTRYCSRQHLIMTLQAYIDSFINMIDNEQEVGDEQAPIVFSYDEITLKESVKMITFSDEGPDDLPF